MPEYFPVNQIKYYSNGFLLKFKNKMTWFLNNIDMKSKVFYDIEFDQLSILSNFLRESTSRICCFEIFYYCMDILLKIKRQILELTLPALPSIGNDNKKIAQFKSPMHKILKPFLKGMEKNKFQRPTKLARNVSLTMTKIHLNRYSFVF